MGSLLTLPCASYGTSTRTKLANAVSVPFRLLFAPAVADGSLVVGWVSLFALWALNAYVLPVGIWNSDNGEFRTTNRTVLGAFLLYFTFMFTLVGLSSEYACSVRLTNAYQERYGARKPPSTVAEPAIGKVRMQLNRSN